MCVGDVVPFAWATLPPGTPITAPGTRSLIAEPVLGVVGNGWLVGGEPVNQVGTAGTPVPSVKNQRQTGPGEQPSSNERNRHGETR